MKTALIIPARNAGPHLDRLLPALAAQTLQPDSVLVVDSSSTDDTVSRFRQFGARVEVIAAQQFNHGGTRRWASEQVDAQALILVIAWHCQVDARAGLIIGDHVTIASHVLILAGGHDPMSPEFWSVSAPVYIDDYAWIATRALIAHGSHIGRGAVVTANTVVAKTVAPYKIIGGSGAKPMGERPHELNYKVGGKGLFTLFY
nr:glycosyltransferase [Pseudomonas chlororaphis]